MRSCSSSNRQHNSSVLHQQGRRHEVGPTVCPSMENLDLVYQETSNSQAQHIPGRLNIVADKLYRLGQTIWTEWSLLPEVCQTLCSRGINPKKICLPQGSTTSYLNCLSNTRSPGYSSRYSHSVMGESGCIQLSTDRHIGQSGGEGKARELYLLPREVPTCPGFGTW